VRSPTARRRRANELGLGLMAVVATGAGYVLLLLANRPDIPADLWGILAVMLGLYLVAHLAVRAMAPRADPTLLPIAAMLNGIGFVVISRLDTDLARVQAIWTGVAVAAFAIVLFFVKHVRMLERYKYTFFLLGLLALVLPLAPGIGAEINGARLWVRVGPVNFQPSEASKVLLVIFFASYLVEKGDLLRTGTRRIGRLAVPDPKHLGPLVLAWSIAVVAMVRQNDYGSSLLLFGVFVLMLYVATERFWYAALGFVMFGAALFFAYEAVGHVRDRITAWVDPWSHAQTSGFQLVQSLYALGSGGFAGTGLGLGSPQKIPNASTDFVLSAIGEELGLLGTVAVIMLFLLFIGSGFRIAVQSERPFSKLFAAGLTVIIGLQTFVIVGGVIRAIPLTGVTLPFISYGGSSLVANFVIVALLLRIDDETVARAEAPGALVGARTMVGGDAPVAEPPARR